MTVSNRSNSPVCEVCRRGPNEGTSLFRQNEYGVKGVWRCREHNRKAVDPEVDDIVHIIEEAQKP